MISKGFIKNSFIYTLAGALPMASAVILLPFYILYLPTEVYGVLSICLAFSIFVQILVTYSFDTSLYIHYHELKGQPDRLATFVSSAFLFMLCLSCGVGLLFTLIGEVVFNHILPNSKISFYPYGLISVGIGIFQAFFKVYGNLLQTREKPETYIWANVIYFSLIAVTTIIGLKIFPQTLAGPLGGRLLIGLLTLLWVLTRVFKEFGFHIKSPWTDTSFSFNAYTFLYQILQWSVNYIDRFVILIFMPLTAVGVYDFAMKCLVGIDLLLNGLNGTINPKVVKLINLQTDKGSTVEINRYFYGLVSLIMLAICLSIFAVPILIDLFIHKSGYAQSVQYIPYLAIIYIFKAVRLYFVLPYSVLKKMHRITALNFFVSLVKVGLMVALISRWHLYGVVISSLVSYAIEIILLWYYLKDDYYIRFNVFKLMVAPFSLLLIIITSESLFGQYPVLLPLGYLVICAALLGMIYRNELKILNPLKFK